MNTNEFMELLEHTWGKIHILSSTKGEEYAGSADRLANFKRLGAELDMDPERVLWVYLTKHLDAIRSYLRTKQTLSEPIEGRIDDAILYLILLKGLVQERGGLPEKVGGPADWLGGGGPVASGERSAVDPRPELRASGSGRMDRSQVDREAIERKLNALHPPVVFHPGPAKMAGDEGFGG